MSDSARRQLFTSESVTMGHPDKVADQVSDGILDAYLAGDPMSRVAVETLLTTGLVVCAGEVTSRLKLTVQEMVDLVRATIHEIGYTDPKSGFDSRSCGILLSIHGQSPDIAMGVNEGEQKDLGAGDQGMMFGYACRETRECVPLPIALANRLVAGLTRLRTSGKLPYLRPDGKTQVTIEYVGDKPVRVHTVVVSSHHNETVSTAQLRRDLRDQLILKTLPAKLVDKKTIIHINPTGRFEVGGPAGDTGVTGRKIIVDTYGGRGRHGGGAFSGKDPTKVDRSASYAARHVAKNIVAAGLAARCEVQLSYAIGVSHPLSINVNTEGTGRLPDEQIEKLVGEHWDLRPGAILQYFNLRRPIYKDTARFGHFGRTGDHLTWERTEKAAALRKAAGLGK